MLISTRVAKIGLDEMDAGSRCNPYINMVKFVRFIGQVAIVYSRKQHCEGKFTIYSSMRDVWYLCDTPMKDIDDYAGKIYDLMEDAPDQMKIAHIQQWLKENIVLAIKEHISRPLGVVDGIIIRISMLLDEFGRISAELCL